MITEQLKPKSLTDASTLQRNLATIFGMETTTNQQEVKPKIVAVMPAYNAAVTLERTLQDIPTGSVQEVILVDDCSSDNTVEIAKYLGLTVIEHTQNRGYGGNQKSCYAAALQTDADVIVMIHPDYQYDSRVIPQAAQIIHLGICDCILGSRIRSRAEALAGGMPRYKYIANRILTTIENVGLGQNLGDFHSGFRAYSRELLETIPWDRNSEDFVFDSQLLVQAVKFGFKLGDIPVPVRYFDEASSINFRRSTTYGLKTLGAVAHFWTSKLGIYTPSYLKTKTD
ncbi:glycosyltransferase family 2 protein [uncultured Rubinisphaera sp.]|uniref:glycosyltransferase family 2 protein n=1 Tax=uncultured Rubinisphaera sp. TaxID=1678686 RepID=UPI0030D998F9